MTKVWASDEVAVGETGKMLLLLALADWSDDSGRSFPTMEMIARKSRLSERHVRRIMRDLEKKGILEIKFQIGDRSHYILRTDKLKNDAKKVEDSTQGGEDTMSAPGGTLCPGGEDIASGGGRTFGTSLYIEEPSPVPSQRPPQGETAPVVDSKPTKKKGSDLPSIPTELDTASFRAAWDSWLAGRRELHKPVTARAAVLQFKFLEKLGVTRAIESIEQSIANGWTGLFEPKEQKANGNGYHRGAPDKDPLFERALAEVKYLGRV